MSAAEVAEPRPQGALDLLAGRELAVEVVLRDGGQVARARSR